MKKFFSLVLALVMALSLTTIAWGAETVVNATSDAEIANALSTTTTAELVINLPATTGSEVFTIELYTNYNAAIKSVTINGTDKTKVKFANAQVRLVDFDEFTITDCEILHMATKSWGHLVFGGSKAGGVYTISDCLFTGVGTQGIYFNPESDAEWNVVGCTFTGDFGDEGAVVLQNNSKPTDLTVTNNDFDVAAGSEELTIHYHKEALTLNADVDETVLIWDAEDFEKAVATADAGDTFKLMGNLDLTATPVEITAPVTIDDNGKTLTGLVAGADITTDANGKITGGTFATTPPAALVAPGYVFASGAVVNNAGQFVGSSSALTSSKATYGATLAAALANKTETVEVKPGLSASASLKTFETYQVFVTTTATGTVSVLPNQYVLVPTAANADIVVVDGSQIVYLMRVPGTAYTDTAKAVKVAFNAKPACGDVYVEAPANAGTYYLYKGEYYVESIGGTLFNVDGMAVYATKTNLVKTLAHTYDYDAKAVTGGKTVVTSVFCSECKQVFDFVEGDVADAVKAFGAGNYADTGLNNVKDIYVRTAATVVGTVTTPSTDKVTSAETFDAGIAMYVGMSVMAAAGSAVVIGKKKD